MLTSSFDFKGTAEGHLEDRGGIIGVLSPSLSSESEPSLEGSAGFLDLRMVLISPLGELESAKGSSSFSLRCFHPWRGGYLSLSVFSGPSLSIAPNLTLLVMLEIGTAGKITLLDFFGGPEILG